jgi:hypothetical protein
MIRKTPVVRILEDIHERTDMRYGQIISNALGSKLGASGCDCGKDFTDGCKCKNYNGRGFNTFGIWDEDLAEMLEAFRFRLFPELKRIKVTRAKRPIGHLTKKEMKRMEAISHEMVRKVRERSEKRATRPRDA